MVRLKVVCSVEAGEAEGTKTMKEFKLMELNVLENQVKEAIKTFGECPRDVTQWAMSAGFSD